MDGPASLLTQDSSQFCLSSRIGTFPQDFDGPFSQFSVLTCPRDGDHRFDAVGIKICKTFEGRAGGPLGAVTNAIREPVRSRAPVTF